MRIGVDATCWRLARGFGRHTRCLLTALHEVDAANQYVLFTDSGDAVSALERLGAVRLVPARVPTIAAAASGSRRSVGALAAMSRAMADPSLDVLLFPTVYSFVPVFSRARKVVIVHDVTADRYPQLTLDGPQARWFWTIKTRLARRQADVLATVSEYSRAGIAKVFRVDPRAVHVVGEASDPIFRRMGDPRPTDRLRSEGITADRRTIVYVGGFSPHKNVDRLVAAFATLASEPPFADVRLALVGSDAEETFWSCHGEIRAAVERLGLSDRVIFTGFLPDDDLVALLNIATVLALPSMMEGFGLPAIEAAACGCPVVATSASPLPALLGDAGLFIDPDDAPALERALRDVLASQERRARMREAGLAAAARLTWPAAARELVRLMDAAVAS